MKPCHYQSNTLISDVTSCLAKSARSLRNFRENANCKFQRWVHNKNWEKQHRLTASLETKKLWKNKRRKAEKVAMKYRFLLTYLRPWLKRKNLKTPTPNGNNFSLEKRKEKFEESWEIQNANFLFKNLMTIEINYKNQINWTRYDTDGSKDPRLTTEIHSPVTCSLERIGIHQNIVHLNVHVEYTV